MTYLLKASEVVAMQRKYKNYQEKRVLGTREQMWDFHWKAGDKNYTIWAMLYKDYTGKNYQGQAWCAMYGTTTTVLCFIEKYGLSVAEAAKATKEFFGGDMPFNCQEFVNHHINDPKLDHTPSVGASVIFYTGKKYGHWGTVTGVDKDGKGYTSTEGNTSGGNDKVDPDGGAVVEKWHRLDPKTYFYHPAYAKENDNTNKPLTTYKIMSVGKDKLTITTNLNVRDYPATGKVTGSYKSGDKFTPIEKTFIDGQPWYKTDKGWISAKYCTGWVQEDNGLWWYIHPEYTCTINNWEKIDGVWYYMDDTGYIATSRWIEWKDNWYYVDKNGAMATDTYIKSTSSEKWYWVNSDGIWLENSKDFTTITKPKSNYTITV